MFMPAENMQIDENALNKISEYLNVPVGTIEVLNIRDHFFGPNRALVFSQDGFVYSQGRKYRRRILQEARYRKI